jgi:hypothetical protein
MPTVVIRIRQPNHPQATFQYEGPEVYSVESTVIKATHQECVAYINSHPHYLCYSTRCWQNRSQAVAGPRTFEVQP